MRGRTTAADTAALRHQIHLLAEEAFHQHLISGHGDSEYPDQYQIIYQGKPKHLPLDDAFTFLDTLIFVSNLGDVFDSTEREEW